MVQINTQTPAFGERLAFLLVVSLPLISIRGYVLTSLIECTLIILIFFNRDVRACYLQAFKFWFSRALFGFYFYILISGFWADAAVTDVVSEIWSWRKLLFAPLVFGLVIRKVERADMILLAMIVAGVVFLVLSFAGLAFVGKDSLFLNRLPSSIAQDHSVQGVLFAFVGSVLILKIFSVKHKLAISFLAFIAALFYSNVIFVTTGRSGYLALVGGVLFVLGYVIFRWDTSKFLKSMVVLMLLIGPMIGFVSSDTAMGRTSEAITNFMHAHDESAEVKTSLGIRRVMWENTVAIIASHWLVGTGAGAFRAAYAQEVSGLTGWRAEVTDDAHQQYLQLLAEFGVIGFFLFVLVLFLAVGTKYHGIEIERKSHSVALTYHSFLMFFLLSLLLAWVNGFMTGFVMGRYFWIALAALAAVVQWQAALPADGGSR